MKTIYLKTLFMAIFTLFAITANAETYSGSCGTSVNWSLDTETGLLKITGTGKMSRSPWSSYRSSIKSVEISEGVTTIGSSAFSGFIGLTSVTIGNSVTTIGSSAFDGCTGLTSVTIGNSVTSIGDYAFYGCTGLTSVTIGNSVTYIGYYAFEGCTGLTSVTIGNSVTSIGSSAFRGCTGLTSVTIPNSVTSIRSSAFEGCTGLTSVTIPNSVTSIGYYAFEGCTGLTSVTIGNSVTSIGDYAFYGCSGITEIYLLNTTPPTINYRAFYLVSEIIPIYVPVESRYAYLISDDWSIFSNFQNIESEEEVELSDERIIFNMSDKSKTSYVVNSRTEIKNLNNEQFAILTTDGTGNIDISQIDSITSNSDGDYLMVINGYSHIQDLSSIRKIEFGYETPYIDMDSVNVTTESIQLAPNKSVKIYVNVDKKEYIGSSLYPFYVEILKDGMPIEPSSTTASVNYSVREDYTGYDIEFTAGAQKEELTCRVVLGSYVKDIPVTVSYGVYLSHNYININDLNNNIGLLTYKSIDVGTTMNYSFFCYLDGASATEEAAIEAQLKDKNNYKITPIGGIYNTFSVELGEITIDKSQEVWVVNVPVTSLAKSYERGEIALTIAGKTLELNLTWDDGKHFSELYVSFQEIYTYSEETKLTSRKMDNSYTLYIDGEQPQEGEESIITMDVYYTMSPDNRGDYIDWNISTPYTLIEPIGYEKISTTLFKFKFKVKATGAGEVKISINNPKADDPTLTEEQKELYEGYRTQTLVAAVEVINRQTVGVNEVIFVDDADPLVAMPLEEMETTSREVPLYAVILPEEAAPTWPAIFSLEFEDGAEATVEQSGIDEDGDYITPEVNITHAGTIYVTATSNDKTDVLKINAKFKLNMGDGDKLQLSTSKLEYLPGETDEIRTIIQANYTVKPEEYTWTSSDESVVKVENGVITTIADGEATITASITDSEGTEAKATRNIKVRTPNADINFDDEAYSDFYVIAGAGDEPTIYYIDWNIEDGSEDSIELALTEEITEEGTYNVAGSITLPADGLFDIVSGTITYANGNWTFDLQIKNYKGLEGTVKGTRPFGYIDDLL